MTRTLFFAAFVALTGGLLLAGSPGTAALGQASGMPGTPQGSTTSSYALAERSLAGALLSNLRAETKFSKLALKNSSDEQVKKVAKAVISENNKLDAQLFTVIARDSAVNTEAYNFGHPTSRARKTAQDLRKLKGTEFDKAYVGEMVRYRQDQQQLIRQNSVLLAASRMRGLTVRIQTNAEKITEQLRQVAG